MPLVVTDDTITMKMVCSQSHLVQSSRCMKFGYGGKHTWGLSWHIACLKKGQYQTQQSYGRSKIIASILCIESSTFVVCNDVINHALASLHSKSIWTYIPKWSLKKWVFDPCIGLLAMSWKLGTETLKSDCDCSSFCCCTTLFPWCMYKRSYLAWYWRVESP